MLAQFKLKHDVQGLSSDQLNCERGGLQFRRVLTACPATYRNHQEMHNVARPKIMVVSTGTFQAELKQKSQCRLN